MILRLRNRVDRFLRGFLAALMGAMVINVLWQVFTRFVLSNPSSFTEELARFMLIWLGILGAGYVGGQKMHLAIDLLGRNVTGWKKIALEIFISFSIFIFAFSVLVVGGTRLVYITWALQQTSASLQLPLAYVYLVLPLSGLLFMFYATVFTIEGLRSWRPVKS